MITATRHLLFGCFLCTVVGFMPQTVIATEADCEPGAVAAPATGMLIGMGEALSFAGAKAAAIADAIATIGTKISAKGSVTEGNAGGSPEIHREVSTETEAFVSGARLLLTCPGEPVRVKIGIPNSVVSAVLAHEADERAHWLQSTVATLEGLATPRARDQAKAAYSAALASEQAAFAAWMVVGRSPQSFKKMDPKQREALERLLNEKSRSHSKTVAVFAADSLAKRSLPALLGYLRRDSIIATEALSAAEGTAPWSCTLTQGDAIGQSVPFTVLCTLTGADLEVAPITARSIAAPSGIDGAALRAIIQRLGS